MAQLTRHRRSNYRILGMIGHGQFGRVYCAMHRKTGRLMAIKRLNRYQLPTHDFLRELHCLLSFNHPNIVSCYALEHMAEGRQLILEYCEGGTLRSLMESSIKLSDTEIRQLLTDILSGLAHAHAQGVIHCDIKPENILLKYEHHRWVAKISDFGIAKLAQNLKGAKAADTGQTGSPAYMAPERFYKQYSPASDIYAIGVLLFELLAGHRPFSGTPTELMSAHLNKPVPTSTSLIEPLKTIILTALEKLPARRYHSALEMLLALQTVEPLSPGLTLPEKVAATLMDVTYQPFMGLPIATFHEPIRHLLSYLTAQEPPLIKDATAWVIACGSRRLYLQADAKNLTDILTTRPFESLFPIRDLNAGQIKGIVRIPQGICLLTDQRLYGFSTPASQPVVQLTPISEWPRSALIAIAPSGRWFAGLTLMANSGQLSIARLWRQQQWVESAASETVQLTLAIPDNTTVEQLLFLDDGHLLVISQSPQQETQIRLLARRGRWLSQYALGLRLQQLTPTQQPYRFLAIDANRPKSAVLLDFKPFRIIRLQLEIDPQYMVAMPWGYLFLDREGRLLLLDRDHFPVGCIEGPRHPTAITPISNHELLIATADQAGGQLYRIDLKDFELDILF